MTVLFNRRLVLALASAFLVVPAARSQQSRTIETTFGAVDIPAEPQRIVTTHYIATQPLLELGMVPVGTGAVDRANTPYWDILKDIPAVSSGAEVSVEKIAALKPDLIFEVNIADERRIAQLRQIAPVIVIGIRGDDRSNWQNRVHQIADAVNRLPQYTALEEKLAARQADIAARNSVALDSVRFSAFAIAATGDPVLFTSNSMSGEILSGAGARYAGGSEALKLANGADVVLSSETIGAALADTDVLLYNTNLDGSESPGLTQFKAGAVYQSIPAVATHRDFPLGKAVIAGFADADALLDRFEKTLAELSLS